MKILLLTHSFNCLSQRLFVELARAGHEVSVEFDVNDEVTLEAVALFRPDVIVAPYLRRAIPEAVWRKFVCLVVHPGIRGDRGPSSLDWAILEGVSGWGVTVLQASAELDAGDIWAERRFELRAAAKSSIYRREVTDAAVAAVLEALERFSTGRFRPEPLDYGDPRVRGRPRPLLRQRERAIDWSRDDTSTVLRKIHAGDGHPGVLDALWGEPYYLFNASRGDGRPAAGSAGTILARGEAGILRATVDGAVWIGHVKSAQGPALKLPAVRALGARVAGLAEEPSPSAILYEERGSVGYLSFDFYNGAMGTSQCEQLRAAVVRAKRRPLRVLVLLGGEEFFSNGIHLHQIEAAASPADESLRNIEAMNELVREILTADGLITIAALRANAGAGGVFLALACDRVYARSSVILNPHYKSMGNLYGSEYWTYSLPRRLGSETRAAELCDRRLPIGTSEAKASGLIDEHFGGDPEGFVARVRESAEALAGHPEFGALVARKASSRRRDEACRPLQSYRDHELERMRLNFYGFDPSYHVARYNFVYRVPHSRTPRHLARHR